MKSIRELDRTQWLEQVGQHHHASRSQYAAMYSTWWNGIVTDPNLMMIPIDDHQVHRGDGVFEAFKAIQGHIYLEDPHLFRLQRSSQAISLPLPFPIEEIKDILRQTLLASKRTTAVLRLFVSRGPGSFTANPYDSVGTQLHVVVTQYNPPAQEKIEKGVSLKISQVAAKAPFWARIKSCNYLPNVLMKKEAIDEGVDFTVGVDEKGFITEGSTENLFLLTKEGMLTRPLADGILDGTTMLRVFELAHQLKEIKGFLEKDITLEDLKQAQEVMMAGTTIDVLSVTQFEGQRIGRDGPGTVADQLRRALLQDQERMSSTSSL